MTSNINTNTYIIKSTKDIEDVDGFINLPVSRNDGKKGKSGIAVQVPEISDSVLALVYNHEKGQAFIRAALNKVRAAIVSEIAKNRNTITGEDIGITAILANLEKHTESQRLTAERIAEWFEADMKPILMQKIEAKYPGISNEKAEKICKPYLDGYLVCAARKSNRNLAEATRNACIKMMESFSEDYDSWVAAKILEILPEVEDSSSMIDAL